MWDIKGKAQGLPLLPLLGGARDKLSVDTTFGFTLFDRWQLAAVVRHGMAPGHKRLKRPGLGFTPRTDVEKELTKRNFARPG